MLQYKFVIYCLNDKCNLYQYFCSDLFVSRKYLVIKSSDFKLNPFGNTGFE